ncbi:MAG: RseA family anti-sigma factor [Thiohalomonadaceae bacterium]
MENHTNEQISALVDDELHGPALRQALERLRQDADLQGRWSRYHLISDTLHANLASARAAHLHQRVRATLEQEPTLLAPRRKPRLPTLAKQVAGVAIAASVAAVAILAVRQEAVEPAGIAPTAMQMAQSPRPAHEMVQLASTGAPATVVVPPIANRGRLNAYLVNHNEYSASSGMQGVLPYVRIVSHETAK